MTTARRATGARNETLQSAAQRVYDAAARDTKAAKAALLIEIRKRPALHEEAFADSVEVRINQLDIQDRAKILRGADLGTVTVPTAANDAPPIYTPQSQASKSASSAAFKRFSVTLTGLYTAKFKDGAGNDFMLGMATPEMLRPVIHQYYSQGSDMVRKARWLEKVAASAKDGVAIHKSVPLADLERMQREANETPV